MEAWLLVPLEADVAATSNDAVQEVVLLVATANELIAHAVIDVQEEVSVLASIFLHDGWQGPSHQRQRRGTIMIKSILEQKQI